MNNSEEKKDINDLRWVRLFSPIHIPKYLVEDIKEKDYTVEDFYKYQELNCLIPSKDGPTLNPFNHLYGLVDENNLTKGFVWSTVSPLSKDFVINNVSVDKEYWGKGKPLKFISDYVREIVKKLKLNKIYWITKHPRPCEKYGFKRSKSVLMEYVEDTDGKNPDGRSNAQGKHSNVKPSTTGAVKSDS